MADWRWIKDGDEPESFLTVWVLLELGDGGARFVRIGYRELAEPSNGISWLTLEEGAIRYDYVMGGIRRVIAWQPIILPVPPIEDIAPEQVATYLREHGWRMSWRGKKTTDWSSSNDSCHAFSQPTHLSARDYEKRLVLFARGLALTEQRPAALILADMAAYPKEEE